MSFFAQKKVWCKFLFIFSKNKKLMIFENFKAHICSHSVGENTVKLYISLRAIWQRKSSQKFWKLLFSKKNRFFHPSGVGHPGILQHLIPTQFWTMEVFLFDLQDFVLVWPCFSCSKVFLGYFGQNQAMKLKQIIFRHTAHPQSVN